MQFISSPFAMLPACLRRLRVLFSRRIRVVDKNSQIKLLQVILDQPLCRRCPRGLRRYENRVGRLVVYQQR